MCKIFFRIFSVTLVLKFILLTEFVFASRKNISCMPCTPKISFLNALNRTCLSSKYSQLSPRRAPLVPALSVRLREMSVLERCPSYKESNKGNKQRRGPTLGVRLIEVSVKRESTVYISIGK